MCMRYLPGLSPCCKLPRACFKLCFRSGHPFCGLACASAVRGSGRHEAPVALLKQMRLKEQGFTLFIAELATDSADNKTTRQVTQQHQVWESVSPCLHQPS